MSAAGFLPRRIAVTGTDTGAGKTFVAAHVARAWMGSGLRVRVAKPVESGLGAARAGESDAEILARAAGDPRPIAEISPFRLASPLAPTVAAAREGVAVDAGAVRRCVRNAMESGDAGLVEGAGGLLVPLAEGLTLRDLAREESLALLVVAADRLGCVNHALLTIEAARAAGCMVCGVALCTTAPSADPSRAANRSQIERLGGVPVLFEVPYVEPGAFWPGLDDRARALVGPVLGGGAAQAGRGREGRE